MVQIRNQTVISGNKKKMKTHSIRKKMTQISATDFLSKSDIEQLINHVTLTYELSFCCASKPTRKEYAV